LKGLLHPQKKGPLPLRICWEVYDDIHVSKGCLVRDLWRTAARDAEAAHYILDQRCDALDLGNGQTLSWDARKRVAAHRCFGSPVL
jgi:hypothetical protein